MAEKDFLDCGWGSRKSRIEKMISSVRDSKGLISSRDCLCCMAFFNFVFVFLLLPLLLIWYFLGFLDNGDQDFDWDEGEGSKMCKK